MGLFVCLQRGSTEEGRSTLNVEASHHVLWPKGMEERNQGSASICLPLPADRVSRVTRCLLLLRQFSPPHFHCHDREIYLHAKMTFFPEVTFVRYFVSIKRK